MDGPDRAFAAIRGPWAGTEGHRDAPFWPTPPKVVERMLDLAEVGVGDRLIDLGCGDGRIVIAAALRGAQATGVDIDPAQVAAARDAARSAGVAPLTDFRQEDLFATRLDGASVVTLYLLPLPNQLLRDRLRSELAPGSRVVSYEYAMPDWDPAATGLVDGRTIYLWTVPSP